MLVRTCFSVWMDAWLLVITQARMHTRVDVYMQAHAYLSHEAWDNAVEEGSLVPISFLSRAQSTEILRRFRSHIRPKLEDDSAGR